ncbi:MAG: CDP-6-deoxy-D-xylo-4-hexulose-3-dehydrase [Candidatus Omnitrophota bacterium]|jgi:CDP-6-deoxy-D-xylo-4-hexulose-3-dehydrase
MSIAKTQPAFAWPLMNEHVNREDLDIMIRFLNTNPKLTQGQEVKRFEKAWSEWLGVENSVFVNSGSSANLITLALLKEEFGTGEVIVSPLNWISDINSIQLMGFKPVFADIRLDTLGMDANAILDQINSNTRAVLLTHIMGFNALERELIVELERRGIWLIEDVCESYGATLDGRRIGSFGRLSNFSYYFGHHSTTIEGGMVCTRNAEDYDKLRMLRSHGMVREASSEELKQSYASTYPDLHPEFIFGLPGFNVRSTEIQAVLGQNQIKRLDREVVIRNKQYQIFLNALNKDKYFVDFRTEGMSNYGFVLMLRQANAKLYEAVTKALEAEGVEFRRGGSGGGNQLRQPYLKRTVGDVKPEAFKNVEHIHFNGFYFGNYPEIEADKIMSLCERLNNA